MIRRILFVLGTAGALPFLAAATPMPATLEIPAILSLSGQGTFVGSGQWQSIQIAESVINRAGGIGGRPVKFTVKDDQTNPQVALQLMQGLIADRVPVVLGPSLAGSCNAISPIVQRTGPVVYCLTAGVKPAAGGFVFSTLPSTPDMIDMAMGYFRNRGWKKVAYLVTTDAGGQDAEQGIIAAAAAADNKGIEIVDREHFAASDLSVAAQLAKIKAAQPEAVVAWVTGTAAGTVLRGVHDAGIDVPIMLSPGNLTPTFMKQYGALLSEKMFLPASAMYGGTSAVGRTTRNAMSAFADAYRVAGLPTDQIAISAWDPTMLLVDTLRKLGPDATPEKVRAYLVGLKGWVGVNGSYDFRAIPQRGVAQEALLVIRWDPARSEFVPSSRLGGKPL
jgi:branched-chain amino acid transport system substrate-binding protein